MIRFTARKLKIFLANFNHKMSEEDCGVCMEACDESLTCGHRVHWQCVARSGRAACPVCRADLELPQEWQSLLQESAAAVAEELQRRANAESENLARQLQGLEIRGADDSQQTRRIQTPHGWRMNVRIVDTDGGVAIDELMSGIARLQHDVANGTRRTEAMSSAVDMVTLLWTLNEISAETGLSTRSLIEALGILAEN